MREAEFLKKNVERWNTYQHTEPQDPDETADRFVNLLDDLSYSKTFYPKSNVTSWINGMAATIYQQIYQTRRSSFKDIRLFWQYELPLLLRKYQKILLFTLFLFILFVAIAVLSSILDPAYAQRYFDNKVQPGYYEMTLDNIHRGDPFGVYKDQNPFSAFMRIAFNNIRVAFTTVLLGLTLGIGTLRMLWTNGLLLGCFEYIFFSQGLGWQSILVVWIHGAIEISSLVIAGCAGFILGKSLLFPGSYTRRASFKIGVKDAINVALALIPFFLIAAFFESYVTHLMSISFETDKKQIGMPVPLGILILVASFSLMTWYFILYPIKVWREGFEVRNKVLFKNGVRYE